MCSAVRGVAQPGRVPALGAGCRRFESSRPDHLPSTQRCHPEAPSQQGVSSGGGPAAMPLSRLDHVNLRTAELAAMQTFYSEVLGMSRSEEHKSELQSLMLISYAVF